MSRALNELFERLAAARANGARVVVPTYYNPYAQRSECRTTHLIAEVIVTELNDELAKRAARIPGIRMADVYGKFIGHGAGSGAEWVYGRTCDDKDLAFNGLFGFPPYLAVAADPHPNALGNQAIADAIVEAFGPAPAPSNVRREGDRRAGDLRLAWDPAPGAAQYEVWVEGSPGYGEDGYSCGPTRRVAVVAGGQPYIAERDLACGLLEGWEILFGTWDYFRYFVKTVDAYGRVSDAAFSPGFVGTLICDPGC